MSRCQRYLSILCIFLRPCTGCLHFYVYMRTINSITTVSPQGVHNSSYHHSQVVRICDLLLLTYLPRLSSFPGSYLVFRHWYSTRTFVYFGYVYIMYTGFSEVSLLSHGSITSLYLQAVSSPVLSLFFYRAMGLALTRRADRQFVAFASVH